jgi:hypothetical protein
VGIKIEGCEGITDIGARREKRAQAVDNERLDIARRDTLSMAHEISPILAK